MELKIYEWLLRAVEWNFDNEQDIYIIAKDKPQII